MTTTAEQKAKEELEALSNPDLIKVRVPFFWYHDLRIPRKDGDEEEIAVFKSLTVGDNMIMERACHYDFELGRGKTERLVDFNEMRRLIIKRNLLSWSLDIPIEHEEGWMTDKCWGQVKDVSGTLMDAFLTGYEQSMMINSEEEEVIDKQSAVLFSPKSRGVSNACEAISLFCTYGNFSEKFGLDREKLISLPYREYLLLKIMIGKEGEATRRNSHRSNDAPRAKIAMGGTQPRASRGKVVRQ